MGHEGSHPLMATRAPVKLPKELAEPAHGPIVAPSDPGRAASFHGHLLATLSLPAILARLMVRMPLLKAAFT
jgi:hypothetical protein